MVVKGLCLSQSTSLYHLFIALAIDDGDDYSHKILFSDFSQLFFYYATVERLHDRSY